MTRTLAACVAVVVSVAAVADDKKELKMPALDAKEWKAFKGEDGMKTWDAVEGKGDEVKAGATVTIHYTGWNLDGKKFDSSIDRNEPAEFPLGKLIKGWQVGVPGMKKGGKRRLYLPARLAYGEKGAPPDIAPNADLVFEIELIDFSNK